MKHLYKYAYKTEHKYVNFCYRQVDCLKYFIYDPNNKTVQDIDDHIVPVGVPVSTAVSSSFGLDYDFIFEYNECFKNGYTLFYIELPSQRVGYNEVYYGVMDDFGKIIIEPKYKSISKFVDGFSIVSNKDYKYGLINSLGEERIPVIYNKLLFMQNNPDLLYAETDNEYLTIDKSNNVLTNVYKTEIIEHRGKYGIKQKCIDKILVPIEYEMIKEIGQYGKIEEHYFIIYKNDKYGLLNHYGNIVFDCVYDILHHEHLNKFSFISDTGTGFLYGNGTIEYSNMYGPFEIFRNSIRKFDTKEVLYNPQNKGTISYLGFNLFKISNHVGFNCTCGVVDEHGNEITPFNASSIAFFEQGYIVYYGKEEYGQVKPIIFDRHGAIVLENKYDYIKSLAYGRYFIVETKTRVGYQNKKGLVSLRGQELFAPIYDYIQEIPEIEGFCLEDNNNVYVLNDKLEIICTLPKKAWIESVYNHVAIVTVGKASGILNFNCGQFIMLSQGCQAVKFANADLIIVYDKDKGYGYIDYSGNIVIPLRFDEAEPFNNGRAKVRIDAEYGYINLKGELQIMTNELLSLPVEYDWGWCIDNFIAVKKGEYYGLLDYNFNIVVPIKCLREEILSTIRFLVADYKIDNLMIPFWDKQRNLFGFKSKQGEVVVPAIFERVLGFGKDTLWSERQSYQKELMYSEGLIAVKLNTLWGYVNLKGEIVIPFMFSKVDYFREGLAAVEVHHTFWDKVKSYHGFINRKGEVVIGIDIKYKIQSGFDKGKAIIEIDPCRPGYENYDVYINKRGEVIDRVDCYRTRNNF